MSREERRMRRPQRFFFYERPHCRGLSLFCEGYLAYLAGVDYERSEGANDMHLLFGTSCCLAELAAALPGEVYAQRPLRLVPDRRPFI